MGDQPGLLDSLLAATAADEPTGRLARFLREPSPWRALAIYLDVAQLRPAEVDRRALAQRIAWDIARLDQALSDQTNAILHHARFQRLEASWRGLWYLTGQSQDAEGIKIRVLDLSWRDLVRDLERAIEFDQSQLFRKVYSEEFGTPGGEPFAVLLGDYEVSHTVVPGRSEDDVRALESIAHVAAAAFAPFIAAAHPSFFGLDEFAALELPLNLPRSFEQAEYLRWRALRDTEDVRFVGLVMPRVLVRRPHGLGEGRADRFCFREETLERSQYLWGTAVWAFGAVLIHAFATCGWLADIRGVRVDEPGGGLVTDLPVHRSSVDRVAPGFSLDATITDRQEKELGDLGFVPLCPCRGTEFSVFHSNQSVQKPKLYDTQAATLNARLSAMLQYMFCSGRFAHYLKVMGRDKVGSFVTTADCESFLQNWLLNYAMANDQASPEVKARHPLRDASVSVKEAPGRPGSFLCIAQLSPHYQLDEVVSTVRLVTELTPGRA